METTIQKVIDELNARIARESEEMASGAPRDVNRLALAAGPDTGALLNVLIRAMNAKQIVEVGTSIGYTALWLGEAARATGGRVVGMEMVETKWREAVDNIARAKLSDVVEVRQGDAKQILEGIAGPIDLAFVDAWKDDYFAYFDALLPKMRIGGCIVADNILKPAAFRDKMAQYQAYVRAKPNVRSYLLPIGSGEEVSVRIA